ncbi:hypothetical protein NEOKW01_1762 [Nematocida sp. AWRm80]|nr:hypothetical protein NEOKW01_1762 [Nematocida sp. AWRm80]
MDGPRLTKMKCAFDKAITQVLKEIETDDISSKELREEIDSFFTQLLLKYSIPTKLNELDHRISKGSTLLYDVTDNESIEQILTSYIHGPVTELLSKIATEEKKIDKEIEELQKIDQKTTAEISQTTETLTNWLSTTDKYISDIKRYIQ